MSSSLFKSNKIKKNKRQSKPPASSLPKCGKKVYNFTFSLNLENIFPKIYKSVNFRICG